MTSQYTLDYLVANLRCLSCDRVSPADLTTEMQTKLRDEPALAYLSIGDELPTDAGRATDKGYIVVRAAEPGEDAVLLQTWGCPDCETPFQWAEIVVSNGKIASIESTPLTKQTLAHANYIEEDARVIAADFIDATSGFDLDDQTVVDTLLSSLPDITL